MSTRSGAVALVKASDAATTVPRSEIPASTRVASIRSTSSPSVPGDRNGGTKEADPEPGHRKSGARCLLDLEPERHDGDPVAQRRQTDRPRNQAKVSVSEQRHPSRRAVWPWQDPGVRRIEVAERRARLARRHRLAPGHRAGDVVEAARSMVCLHATDPATVYLSAWARVDGMTVADLERALYVDRSLVKHLAMRRTLFVFPRETMRRRPGGSQQPRRRRRAAPAHPRRREGRAAPRR